MAKPSARPSLLTCFTFLLLIPSSLAGPRLGLTFDRHIRRSKTLLPNALNKDDDDNKWFVYPQTLDHFNYNPQSYTKFSQRYAINTRYWGGPNTVSPIFVVVGDEGNVETLVYGGFFFTTLASRFNALILYIEHRYYGRSMPFGSDKEAYRNSSTRGYFSSTQAMADYAEVILHVKKTLRAERCPVITIGGSYGGMLAAWFRLKYPHIAMGALASSAPILYFDDITPQNAYFSVVTKDFRDVSESCNKTIKQSWFDIDHVASLPCGLDVLRRTFNTCRPITDTKGLKDYLNSIYAGAAQYDNPPLYFVKNMCDAIDNAVSKGTLLRIKAGIVAAYEDSNCVDTETTQSGGIEGWDFQACSEMVMPIGRGINDTMFPPAPFDLQDYTKECQKRFGVTPRPHWATTEFGGHNISFVLKNFASNIIFSNGLRDPYSAAGVLKSISDSVVALVTEKGAHCLDTMAPSEDDPEWLVEQRHAEIEIIGKWLLQYKADLDKSVQLA